MSPLRLEGLTTSQTLFQIVTWLEVDTTEVCKAVQALVLTMQIVQLVFGVCAAGATILTVNANLLGGNIGFFQSMCLLGYCLFPLDIAALVTAFVTNIIVRWVVVVASVVSASPSLALSKKDWG